MLLNSAVDFSDIDTALDMPDELACKLLPHQVQGIQWMISKERAKNRGGILGERFQLQMR